MTSATVHGKVTEGWIRAAVRGALTKVQARRLAKEDPEVVALASLAASKRIAELQGRSHEPKPSPSTPSGMVPVYTKPNTPKRHKKPGAKNGHQGIRHSPHIRSYFERVQGGDKERKKIALIATAHYLVRVRGATRSP